MPTTLIDIQELPSRFTEIVELARTGTEVIVTEGQVPRAKLLPIASAKTRIPGLHAGAWTFANDFDAPLPDDFWTGES
jgi:antitoxin (DNA-binding transcriptional repressor) of toxin-antitoxin stability system